MTRICTCGSISGDQLCPIHNPKANPEGLIEEADYIAQLQRDNKALQQQIIQQVAELQFPGYQRVRLSPGVHIELDPSAPVERLIVDVHRAPDGHPIIEFRFQGNQLATALRPLLSDPRYNGA